MNQFTTSQLKDLREEKLSLTNILKRLDSSSDDYKKYWDDRVSINFKIKDLKSEAEKAFLNSKESLDEVSLRLNEMQLSDKWVGIEKQIEDLKAEQEKMKIEVAPEFEEVEKAYKDQKLNIIELMNIDGSNCIGRITGKEKTTKEVNVTKLFSIVQDPDLVISFINIPQTSIKKMEKDEVFSFCKKELKECISIKETEVVDLIVNN